MAYASPDGQIREELNIQHIVFEPMNALSAAEIKRIIDIQKPDIIHAHDRRASFMVARACGKIPMISHVHNNHIDSHGFTLKSIAYLYAGIKAKHILWVSQSAFSGYRFHNLFKKKSSILYNVIDIHALYSKLETDRQTYDYDVVYVGRLTHQKNPIRLMNVCRKIVTLCPNVKIAIVGTGDMEDQTKEACKELKLQDHVSFLGFCRNPLKIMQSAKVMIMTSLFEGTPMCALEAMALGVPIVSTPVDGLKDLISNGKNGFLCEKEKDLALHVQQIITSRELHKRLSANMIRMSQRLNDETAYKSVINDIYNKCLQLWER